jgi:hypothetical protein
MAKKIATTPITIRITEGHEKNPNLFGKHIIPGGHVACPYLEGIL